MNQLTLPITEPAATSCVLSGEILRLRVPCVPVAQPRVKVSSFGGRARAYNPTTIKNAATGEKKPHPIVAFKATLRMAASQHYTAAPVTGPLRIDVTLVFPRPDKAIWKTKPMPRYRHVQKPDRDNCDKAILDSLNGIVFADDCQVCDGRIEKWHASGDEQPHVLIVISRAE